MVQNYINLVNTLQRDYANLSTQNLSPNNHVLTHVLLRTIKIFYQWKNEKMQLDVGSEPTL